MKNAGMAAILSFFFAGLGQIYNGQIGKGILFMVVQTVNVFLIFAGIGIITYPIVWIWGMIDAHKSAERINLNQKSAE